MNFHPPVELLCPEARLRIPFAAQPRRALAPEIEPPRLAGQLVHGSSSEHRSGTAPHHLAPLVLGVRCDQFVEPVGVLVRGREPLQRVGSPSRPSRGSARDRRRESRARKAARDRERSRRAARPALDAAASRAPERPRSAQVDRAKPALLVTVLVTVLRVSRPAVVECSLGVLDDLPDRSDATRLPSVLGQPLVSIRLEEHLARLNRSARRRDPTVPQDRGYGARQRVGSSC